MSRVVGIDPGLEGGVAILEGNKILKVVPMPKKPGPKGGEDVDAAALAELLKAHAPYDRVVVEIVHAMKGQGVTSMFTFGKGYGKLLAVLEVLGLPVIHVTPQQWKKVILAGLGRQKSDSIRYVMGLFPGIDLKATPKCKTAHDGMAEAACLAEYARRDINPAPVTSPATKLQLRKCETAEDYAATTDYMADSTTEKEASKKKDKDVGKTQRRQAASPRRAGCRNHLWSRSAFAEFG